MALEAAMEIYAEFGWTDAPREHLGELQNQRFGPAREWQPGDRLAGKVTGLLHAQGGAHAVHGISFVRN